MQRRLEIADLVHCVLAPFTVVQTLGEHNPFPVGVNRDVR